mmetsp:Transcript_37851/g.72533  ORF Transcript_37851/g.72533 Transcript_37851/m.72533 type:complete len:327 (+) Transcript_37851:1310-2290(+)
MPNSFTSFRLVDTATMCLATASSPRFEVIQVRTVRALSMVSAVVNVLDTTTTSVCSGSNSLSALATSTGSTLARNRSLRPRASSMDSGLVRSAVSTNRGPRKLPPMPMATTLISGLPEAPTHSPSRTRSEKTLILSSTSCTSGTTFLPSAMITSEAGARRAGCSTARSSVELMCSPENMLRILPCRSACSASASSLSSVASVTRWREKSTYTPLCSRVHFWNRFSSRSRSRRWVLSISSTCAFSAAHSSDSEMKVGAAFEGLGSAGAGAASPDSADSARAANDFACIFRTTTCLGRDPRNTCFFCNITDFVVIVRTPFEDLIPPLI